MNRNSVRILLTGSSGFIGRALLRKLQEADHQVLAIARRPLIQEYPDVRWESADLSIPATYQDLLFDFKPQVVFHLAWQGIPDFSLDASLANLHHSLELLNAVMEMDSCKKILVAGSCFELNKLQGECLETEDGEPKDHFTWAKHSLRDWLLMESTRRGVNVGWMRIFYAYGPYQRAASLLPTILTHLQKGQLPPIKTPYNANDFVYVDDVAEGFIRAMENESVSGTFHLGSGISTPIIELCRLAEQQVCRSTELTRTLAEQSEVHSQSVNFWSDCSRSKVALGWVPTTSLQEGIDRTWQWMQQL